ncbi:hypothetical protein QQF64_019769 [Cirrhinus molitorella]|uniref:Uncharacterized protein n=1 Tax=Cirrhinus molitorella TaxID=172907 RepID=A0ABR3LKH9_9TELE
MGLPKWALYGAYQGPIINPGKLSHVGPTWDYPSGPYMVPIMVPIWCPSGLTHGGPPWKLRTKLAGSQLDLDVLPIYDRRRKYYRGYEHPSWKIVLLSCVFHKDLGSQRLVSFHLTDDIYFPSGWNHTVTKSYPPDFSFRLVRELSSFSQLRQIDSSVLGLDFQSMYNTGYLITLTEFEKTGVGTNYNQHLGRTLRTRAYKDQDGQ